MKLLWANLALAGPTVGSRGAETPGAGAGFGGSRLDHLPGKTMGKTMGKPWENGD